jgi:hypothetical protein
MGSDALISVIVFVAVYVIIAFDKENSQFT